MIPEGSAVDYILIPFKGLGEPSVFLQKGTESFVC
jgi:hypothetical protein